MAKSKKKRTEHRLREKARAMRRGLAAVNKSDYTDFMEECIAETGDEEMCQIFWDEGSE